MIDPKTVDAIRELHSKGWSISRIAKKCKCSRTTVRKYINKPLTNVEPDIGDDFPPDEEFIPPQHTTPEIDGDIQDLNGEILLLRRDNEKYRLRRDSFGAERAFLASILTGLGKLINRAILIKSPPIVNDLNASISHMNKDREDQLLFKLSSTIEQAERYNASILLWIHTEVCDPAELGTLYRFIDAVKLNWSSFCPGLPTDVLNSEYEMFDALMNNILELLQITPPPADWQKRYQKPSSGEDSSRP